MMDPIEVDPALLDTTRNGYLTLWGPWEISDYAEIVAGKHPRLHPVLSGGRRIPRTRVKLWQRNPEFPDPFARLQMGLIYLASEVAPWVDTFLSKKSPSAPLPEAVTAAIAAEYGRLSIHAAAVKHNVSDNSVDRIWRPLRRSKG